MSRPSLRTAHLRAILSALLVTLLVLAVPAIGATADQVHVLRSSTHPVEGQWYSDADVSFDWQSYASHGPFDTPGWAWDCEKAGDYLYVADGFTGGLCVMDAISPDALTVHDSVQTTGTAYAVDVEGDICYVADAFEGLLAYDISDPIDSPVYLGRYDTSGSAWDVEVVGDVAYVADGGGVATLDVTDPGAPTLLDYWAGPSAQCVKLHGDHLYVGCSNAYLWVFDVSDPTDIQSLLTFGSTTGYDLEISGDLLFSAAGSFGVKIFDISDPSTPVEIGTAPTDNSAYGVDVAGNVLYQAQGSLGMAAFDITDPRGPVRIGRYIDHYARSVLVEGDDAFLCTQDDGVIELGVAEFESPTTLLDTAFQPMDGPYIDVVADGMRLIAVSASGRLRSMDCTLPTAIEVGPAATTAGSPTGAASIDLQGDNVFVADVAGDVVHIYELSASGTIDDVGQATGFSNPRAVDAEGDVLYVGEESRLYSVATTDLANPQILDYYQFGTDTNAVVVDGNVAYLALNTGVIASVDVSDPSNLLLLDTSSPTSRTIDLAVAGNTLYGASDGGLVVVNVSDPTSLDVIGVNGGQGFFEVEVAGDEAFTPDPNVGVVVWDLSDHFWPTVSDTFYPTGPAMGVAAAGDTLYVAEHSPGDEISSWDIRFLARGVSYSWDTNPSGTPDTVVDTWSSNAFFTGLSDGTRYFHIAPVDFWRARLGTVTDWTMRIDAHDPSTTSNVTALMNAPANITLTPTDLTSWVAETRYILDGGAESLGTALTVTELGPHTLEFWSVDAAGNVEAANTVDFSVRSTTPAVWEGIAGTDRYATAVAVSKKAFPGGADAVVVATGENWPDALGGAALAGAAEGPILLTRPDTLPSSVSTEISRLGATRAFVLGGTAVVGESVVSALERKGLTVTRLGGANRYATSRLVAQQAIAELGADFDGTAFVATGGNFPDALAGSPLSGALGWPIYVADPSGSSPASGMKADGVTDAIVLGGTAVVSSGQESALKMALGSSHVSRIAGSDRYDTAARIATYGVDQAGLRWDRLALATGENFPDALAGGALPAANQSVLLLSQSGALPSVVRNKLAAQKAWIARGYYLGGTGALSQDVRDDVEDIW